MLIVVNMERRSLQMRHQGLCWESPTLLLTNTVKRGLAQASKARPSTVTWGLPSKGSGSFPGAQLSAQSLVTEWVGE